MPKFVKEKKTGEFVPYLAPSPTRSNEHPDIPAVATKEDTGRQLSEFYASLVETSGKPWAREDCNIPSADNKIDQKGATGTAAKEREAERVEILPPGEHYLAPAGPQLQPYAKTVPLVLPRSNVGWKLLEKAGWKEGTGIGATEQGQLEPLQPDMRQGNVGLGYQKKGLKRKKVEEKDHDTKTKESGGGKVISHHPGPSREQPPDELTEQNLETRVKRVKQVMQAEVDEKAEKSLARFVYSAFKDEDGPGGSTRDTNPLLRRNRKISARNPLL